jgi:hypothetical protein
LVHAGSVSRRIRLVNGRFRGITLELSGAATAPDEEPSSHLASAPAIS